MLNDFLYYKTKQYQKVIANSYIVLDKKYLYLNKQNIKQ
jgi:hypothetical protein